MGISILTRKKLAIIQQAIDNHHWLRFHYSGHGRDTQHLVRDGQVRTSSSHAWLIARQIVPLTNDPDQWFEFRLCWMSLIRPIVGAAHA